MKGLIVWDKKVFDERQRSFVSAGTIYTQLHIPEKNKSWSIVLDCESTALEQDYISIANVRFLVDDAPHHLLVGGFIFPVVDGATVVGSCEIFEY